MTERPRFDPTVNLGHLLSMGTIGAALIGGWYVADYRLSAMERQLTQLSTIVVQSARIEERLKDHARRLDWLERRP